MDDYKAGGLKYADRILPSLQLLSVKSSRTEWGQLDLLAGLLTCKNKRNKNASVIKQATLAKQ